MTIGHVSDLHILVPVRFRLSNKADISVEFVVDTGFTGFLCLPSSSVIALGLPFRYDLSARLADDSTVILPVHDAIISWNGTDKKVDVLATGKRPLLGTALLDGYELLSEFRENGTVSITAL